MTQLVVDANVLGDVCRNNEKAREVLCLVKINRLKVIFCTEILKEYKPRFKDQNCNENHRKVLQEWHNLVAGKFGRKVTIDKNNIERCFSRLIDQNKFGDGKDIIYVKAAEKIKDSDKILIAYEWHFQNADPCIAQLGIKRLDLDEAVEVLKSN